MLKYENEMNYSDIDDTSDIDEEEEAQFQATFNEVFSEGNQIKTVTQLKKVFNDLKNESNNTSNQWIAYKYMATATIIALDYAINHYNELYKESELSTLLKDEAVPDNAYYQSIFPDKREYTLIRDVLETLIYRDNETQFRLGSWIPYHKQDFTNSIFNYDYLRYLYENSRYLVICYLAKQAHKDIEDTTEEKLWKLLLNFQATDVLSEAYLNLYFLHISDETPTGKLSTDANRYLIKGYGLRDFDTAVERKDTAGLFLAEEYASAWADGTLLSKSQNFNEGFALLQRISSLSFSCGAKDLANSAIGKFYEDGEYIPKDLSRALDYYKKAGDEEEINRLNHIKRASNSSTTTTHSSDSSYSSSTATYSDSATSNDMTDEEQD